MSAIMDNLSHSAQLKNGLLGRNGHDYIASGFTPTAGRTYLWFIVDSDATVTYTDALGQTHTSKTLLAGTYRDLSGVAPTVTSGEICAWIDDPGA